MVCKEKENVWRRYLIWIIYLFILMYLWSGVYEHCTCFENATLRSRSVPIRAAPQRTQKLPDSLSELMKVPALIGDQSVFPTAVQRACAGVSIMRRHRHLHRLLSLTLTPSLIPGLNPDCECSAKDDSETLEQLQMCNIWEYENYRLGLTIC